VYIRILGADGQTCFSPQADRIMCSINFSSQHWNWQVCQKF